MLEKRKEKREKREKKIEFINCGKRCEKWKILLLLVRDSFEELHFELLMGLKKIE